MRLLPVYFPHDLSASQGRLSIPIAGLWKSTGSNLANFYADRPLFFTSQCQLALENETLRKYTILDMLYKFECELIYQLTIKDIPELKCAAESKPCEDEENELR